MSQSSSSQSNDPVRDESPGIANETLPNMSESSSHASTTGTNASPSRPRVLYGTSRRPVASDEATTRSSPPVVLGIVPIDRPRSSTSTGSAASKKPKRNTRASASASTSKVTKKKNQRSSTSSAAAATTTTTASSSNPAATEISRTHSSAELTADTHLMTRSNARNPNSLMNSTMRSVTNSDNPSGIGRYRLPVRSGIADAEQLATPISSRGTRNRYLETPALNAETNISFFNSRNRFSSNSTRVALSDHEQQQLQQMTTQARARRARDTMHIDFVLNQDFPSASGAGAASPGSGGATTPSALSDFDRQFFFGTPRTRITTAATGTAAGVVGTSAPSPTALSPPADSSSDKEDQPDTKKKKKNNSSYVESTRDRPGDRDVERFMRPEQRRYEDTLLEILDGLELPFNA
ncbi:hypothetical protein UA08_02852 [Talaromyces atroroseus]|uniref:Uncharacterized protein n=1 Tax=Talaromyces atroroseus TaxID=1441469 RepID=A0A225B7E2_TALAT|nr:hypothetical protein UA08_02852 [Talaromyces atroroseus]OKL61847.1 hypothetical protein UA08_02852 [Talaromyces atroroseus]